MKIYENKEITEVKKVLKCIKCDRCQKEIDRNKRYYSVTVGHRDYMEACDETEYRHSCSDECLLKEVERFFRIKENDSTYMEIETENGHLR